MVNMNGCSAHVNKVTVGEPLAPFLYHHTLVYFKARFNNMAVTNFDSSHVAS